MVPTPPRNASCHHTQGRLFNDDDDDGDGDDGDDDDDDDDVMVMVMMITYTCIAQSLHSIVACSVRSGEKKKMWKKSSILFVIKIFWL